MADYTQNITNTVRVFGEGPSTKWGQSLGAPYTMTWGSSNWGEGLSLIKSFIKVIENSQPSDFSYYRSDVSKLIEFSAPVTCDMGSERLTDGTGTWRYVFVSDTTEGEDRDFASWSESESSAASFTCQAAASTSWT